jgi:hypothetical protein
VSLPVISRIVVSSRHDCEEYCLAGCDIKLTEVSEERTAYIHLQGQRISQLNIEPQLVRIKFRP